MNNECDCQEEDVSYPALSHTFTPGVFWNILAFGWITSLALTLHLFPLPSLWQRSLRVTACIINHRKSHSTFYFVLIFRWRHISVMASQITGNSAVCSAILTTVFMLTTKKISLSLALCEKNVSGGLGPVTLIAFPWHDVIMDTILCHDVDKICWPQPIRRFKLGHAIRIPAHGLSGTDTWPEENNFHKKWKRNG